ncbi:magnesium transporter [Chitinibacter tainanensis]|uniref:magnesium transporter n=1 Tax=Chitinibacter tainanensis TaxID=230667 RepID=UPI002353C7E4|nr:magnesium transporter [Chitinibacter tainanensis]
MLNRAHLLVQLATPNQTLTQAEWSWLLHQCHPSDLAGALQEKPVLQQASELLRLSPAERALLFSHLPALAQDGILKALPQPAAVALFEQMPPDERADVFKRLDLPAQAGLLPALTPAARQDLLQLAAYAEGTVGAVTTSRFVAATLEMTAAQAWQHLRASAQLLESVPGLFVLDHIGKLCGTIDLPLLLAAADGTPLAELMRPEPVYARVGWPQSEAVALIRHYDLLALPVCNEADQMVGIVTVDDALEIEEERQASQLVRFGGTQLAPSPDLDIMQASTRTMFGVRAFWLVILTVFGILTSTFVAAQEEILSQAIVLAAFIAPIVDMGGNAGSQSATLVLRAMALGELKVKWRDIRFIILRELPVALALGITVAVLECILAYFSKGVGIEILLTVGLSMLACTVLGGLIGALLPFGARKIGTDPATLSAPLITSIMDLVGVFIYFGFAYLFLGHLLH